jgi:hypothetical protein
MSNPFINNRFKVLDTNKSEKEKYVAPRGANNFTQPHKPETNTSGPFRSQRTPSIAKLVAPTFNMEEHLFPILGNNLSTKPQLAANETFKDAVKTVKHSAFDEQNSIKPGWVEVTGVKGKTCYNYRYGEKTEYQTKMEERAEVESTPNYIMNAAINKIMKQRERHINEYNSIHGEGEYEDKFIMSPCYGSEYDTDEDAEEVEGEDDSNEYDWY